MKKTQPFQTTLQEIDTFLKTEKYIILPEKFEPRSKEDKRYFVLRSDFYNADDVIIPQWFFQISVRVMVPGKDHPDEWDCEDSYSLAHIVPNDKEYIVRLDVHPKDLLSHQHHDNTDFYGAHLHYANDAFSWADKFDFDCENCQTRQDWLAVFAQQMNFTIKYIQTTNDLFGGWECSA